MTIKELRIQQGLSQRDFAQKAGIARSALQKYENGQAVPTPLVLQRVWEAFGQTVSAEAATARKPEIIIQSPYGGEISAEEVAQRVGDVDAAYVRVDHNMIYWVKGDEKGELTIWE